jgi:hypothetical protein
LVVEFVFGKVVSPEQRLEVSVIETTIPIECAFHIPRTDWYDVVNMPNKPVVFPRHSVFETRFQIRTQKLYRTAYVLFNTTPKSFVLCIMLDGCPYFP